EYPGRTGSCGSGGPAAKIITSWERLSSRDSSVNQSRLVSRAHNNHTSTRVSVSARPPPRPPAGHADALPAAENGDRRSACGPESGSTTASPRAPPACSWDTRSRHTRPRSPTHAARRARDRSRSAAWSARTGALNRSYQRHVDQVLGQKPRLQLVAAHDIADEHIVRPVIAHFRCLPRH